MDDKENEFRERLRKEQEEEEYREWKKSNAPKEVTQEVTGEPVPYVFRFIFIVVWGGLMFLVWNFFN
jgi:hypothetical protein